MLLIPEITLRDGQHVPAASVNTGSEPRPHGDMPDVVIQRWLKKEARRLHLSSLSHTAVDKQKNDAALRALVNIVNAQVPLQFDGNIRDFDTIERALDLGISYVVLGSPALQNPGFLQDACLAFGGSIIARLDARGGKAIAHGGSKLTGHDIADLARKFEDYGCEAILYTDTEHEGPLQGLALDVMMRIADAVKAPVIANARQIHLTDISTLCTMQEHGIEGIVCSSDADTDSFDFTGVQKRVDALCNPFQAAG